MQVALALFGLSAPKEGHKWNDLMAQVCELGARLGVPINKVHATFGNKPKGLVSNKSYEYQRYSDRINKQILAGNVNAIGMVSLADETRYLMFDWQLDCEYGLQPSSISACVIGMNQNLFERHFAAESDRMNVLFDHFRKYVDITYGFGVAMARRYLPVGFCLGLATDMPEELKLEASRWLVSGGPKCGKILRNVYGFNILGKEHLNLRVGDLTLEQWIQNGDDRGLLKSLGNELYLWTFDRNNNRMNYLAWDCAAVIRVRKILNEHGVFSWQRTN